jgi:hypothetical protein
MNSYEKILYFLQKRKEFEKQNFKVKNFIKEYVK